VVSADGAQSSRNGLVVIQDGKRRKPIWAGADCTTLGVVAPIERAPREGTTVVEALSQALRVFSVENPQDVTEHEHIPEDMPLDCPLVQHHVTEVLQLFLPIVCENVLTGRLELPEADVIGHLVSFQKMKSMIKRFAINPKVRATPRARKRTIIPNISPKNSLRSRITPPPNTGCAAENQKGRHYHK
jgi:hypothetical protein